MKDNIILPDIPMILDIREEYRQDPIYWALTISMYHVIAKNYLKDAKIIKQFESDNSFSDEVSLMFIIEKDKERMDLIAFNVEDETGLYIMVQHLQKDYYFKVKKNSRFESLDVVTDESLINDFKLVKLIKDPSNETLGMFGRKKEVKDKLDMRKRKISIDPVAMKLYKGLFD